MQTSSSFSYSSVSSKHAIHSGASTFSVAHSAGTASSFTLTNNNMDNTSVTSPSESTASSALAIPIPVLLEPPDVPTIAVSEKSSFVDSEVEPDVLVLGFEELDLSTEALLYSTSTVREDAWTGAILAALGEKAEMYEKVG
jgi:phosphatidylinositol-bisphosphatase